MKVEELIDEIEKRFKANYETADDMEKNITELYEIAESIQLKGKEEEELFKNSPTIHLLYNTYDEMMEN